MVNTGTAMFVVLGLALAAGVAVAVLRPVWREARRPALLIGLGTIVVAGLLYRLVGTPAALDPGAHEAPPAPTTMAAAIAQLEVELEREPQQAEGWRLLGRAYRAQGRAGDAAAALARAARLLPDEPDVLVEAAEARALAQPDRTLDAQSVAWLDHALAVDPAHQRARWFRGIAHRQSGEPAMAAETWAPLLAQVDAGTAGSLRDQVDLARRDAGLPPLPAPTAAPGSASDAEAAAPAITVTVDVAPALADRIPAGAILYVIARPAGGPPMPVAVERLAVSGFPVEVVLDDADGPMPTRRLSQAGPVEIVARISASGDATAQPGDLESAPAAASPGATVAAVVARVVE